MNNNKSPRSFKLKNYLIFFLIIIICAQSILLILSNKDLFNNKFLTTDSNYLDYLQKVKENKQRDSIIKKLNNPNYISTTEEMKKIIPREDSIFVKSYCGYIPVHNFYRNSKFITRDWACSIVEENTYTISYDKTYESFIITIHDENIDDAILKAEQKFLHILGIDKEQACNLNVRVAVEKSFKNFSNNPNKHLNPFKLSFCYDYIGD